MKKVVKFVAEWCNANFELNYKVRYSFSNENYVYIIFESFVPMSLLLALDQHFKVGCVFDACEDIEGLGGVKVLINLGNDEN